MVRKSLVISLGLFWVAAIAGDVWSQGWGRLPTVEFEYGRGSQDCGCRDRGPRDYRGGGSPQRDWYVAASWQPGPLPMYRNDYGEVDPRWGHRADYAPRLAYDDRDYYRPAALPIRYDAPRADVPLDIAPFVAHRPQDTEDMYLGKGLFGQPRAFAKDEPVRNLFRYLLP
jgi:hypothetical protein